MPDNIINVRVELSEDKTSAAVSWVSGQAGRYGRVYYAQGVPTDGSLVYSTTVEVGPSSSAQDRFEVTVTGLTPTLPYSFYAATVDLDNVTVLAQMTPPDYLLNPVGVTGVLPIVGGYPLGGPFQLGADHGVNEVQGTVPGFENDLDDWFQNMAFEKVGKILSEDTAFQVVETTTVIPFRGFIVPERAWEMNLKPQWQRTWRFYKCYAEKVLPLFTDDVIVYDGNQYRVTGVTSWKQFGYMEYEIAQDWVLRGPTAAVS